MVKNTVLICIDTQKLESGVLLESTACSFNMFQLCIFGNCCWYGENHEVVELIRHLWKDYNHDTIPSDELLSKSKSSVESSSLESSEPPMIKSRLASKRTAAQAFPWATVKLVVGEVLNTWRQPCWHLVNAIRMTFQMTHCPHTFKWYTMILIFYSWSMNGNGVSVNGWWIPAKHVATVVDESMNFGVKNPLTQLSMCKGNTFPSASYNLLHLSQLNAYDHRSAHCIKCINVNDE